MSCANATHQRKKCYIYKIFTILLKQILSGRLLLVITTGMQKSNLSFKFKLESITTYHL